MTSSDGDPPTVRCRGLARVYRLPTGEVPAIKGVDLDAAPGTITAVAGPSGVGKSTLLRLIGCLERPDAGSIHIGGVDVTVLPPAKLRRFRREHVRSVFQDPAANLIEYLTVRGHVDLAARMHDGRPEPRTISRLLADLGIEHLAERRPGRLSAGEQQRVALASAAAGPPGAIVADEPTAHLDRATVESVASALQALADRGATVITATHDPELIETADDVVRIGHG